MMPNFCWRQQLENPLHVHVFLTLKHWSNQNPTPRCDVIYTETYFRSSHCIVGYLKYGTFAWKGVCKSDGSRNPSGTSARNDFLGKLYGFAVLESVHTGRKGRGPLFSSMLIGMLRRWTPDLSNFPFLALGVAWQLLKVDALRVSWITTLYFRDRTGSDA